MPGMGRYQGEVVGKHEIHELFRAKVSVAKNNPEAVQRQDWEGMRLILEGILSRLGRRAS